MHDSCFGFSSPPVRLVRGILNGLCWSESLSGHCKGPSRDTQTEESTELTPRTLLIHEIRQLNAASLLSRSRALFDPRRDGRTDRLLRAGAVPSPFALGRDGPDIGFIAGGEGRRLEGRSGRAGGKSGGNDGGNRNGIGAALLSTPERGSVGRPCSSERCATASEAGAVVSASRNVGTVSEEESALAPRFRGRTARDRRGRIE